MAQLGFDATVTLTSIHVCMYVCCCCNVVFVKKKSRWSWVFAHISVVYVPMFLIFNSDLLPNISDILIPYPGPTYVGGLQKVDFNIHTDRRTDSQSSIDSPIHKLSENIYFMGSEMKIVEISHGMTNLYVPFFTV